MGQEQVRQLEIGADSDGQRLDNFLMRELKGLPKSRVYRMIRKGEVRINRKRARPDTRLASGDLVRVPPVRLPDRNELPAPGADLIALLTARLLFENDDFLVLNKPAGLSVHGGSGVRLGLIEALRQMRPQWRELELAHRLDRDTSGCLLISKNTLFLRCIHKQLKLKSVEKIYLALVQGYWPDSRLQVDAPLVKNHLASGERMVRVEAGGKPSRTRFTVVERFGRRATLLQAAPETGRTHQIRVHCQVAGHPILGDPKYADHAYSGIDWRIPGLCLHAHRLAFSYPLDGPRFAFEAEPDAALDEQLKLLRSV